MALTPAGLKAKIITELTTSAAPSKPEELEKFADALAKAIVSYILASAEVQGLVGSGAGAGGTVTGKVL